MASTLKAVDYVILGSPTKKELVAKVREWIEKGWESQGAFVIDSEDKTKRYCQTMIERKWVDA